MIVPQPSVMGSVVAVVGMLLIVFNARWSAFVERLSPRRANPDLWLFRPLPGGALPVVYLIGAGWAVGGVVIALFGE